MRNPADPTPGSSLPPDGKPWLWSASPSPPRHCRGTLRHRAQSAGLVLLGCIACGGESRSPASSGAAGTYRAAVDEGPGLAVAILLDNSGSMRERVRGDPRPKSVIARAAIETMLDATDGFRLKHPDLPVRVTIFEFTDDVARVLPVQSYNRDSVHAALARIPPPGGPTAIGEALDAVRAELYRAGVFRKYILAVTDGESNRGRPPGEVAGEIWRRSEGGVHIYFVAFDVDPKKFGFLHRVQGAVVGAANAGALHAALSDLYQQRILVESMRDVEPPRAPRDARQPTPRRPAAGAPK